MYKQAMIAGTVFAMLAVILGAFGAHALKERLASDMVQVFETGVRYQMYHSFALLVTGIVYPFYTNKTLKLATLFFIIGIVLFSGSLYAMALMSLKGMSLGKIGMATPIGGFFFIIGWAELLFGIVKKK
ncbi:MAG: hypothetical protein K0Q79_1384 [Flavipsychrobacter sp.]|jgi:uncharacterized membrane protein YgdD (TMEM256/DUF423 family)|nr:hypothetical protein [Flavipsychrobacter sp.]